MRHIRIRDVSVFSIVLCACLAFILFVSIKDLLKMMNILFYSVKCLNLTFVVLLSALNVF